MTAAAARGSALPALGLARFAPKHTQKLDPRAGTTPERVVLASPMLGADRSGTPRTPIGGLPPRRRARHAQSWRCADFALVKPGVAAAGFALLLQRLLSSFDTKLAGSFVLHVADMFNLTTLVKQHPASLVTAMVFGDVYSIVCHLCYAKGGDIASVYDFFIGWRCSVASVSASADFCHTFIAPSSSP